MPANDHLLNHLCQEEDTLNEAKALLRRAQRKTGPGSGYELGPHTTGLPAICALLASQKLNNSDVTEKAAQMASCLKASDFNKALAIVQAAVAVGGTAKEVDPKKLYDHLISYYNPSASTRSFTQWLKEAGEMIQAEDKKLNPEDPSHGKVIKSAIFYWTYEAATGKPPATQKDFAEEQSLQPRTFSRVLNKISTACPILKSRIARDVAEKAKATPVKAASTPRRTPRKQPLRELPSRDRDTPTKSKLDGHEGVELSKRRLDQIDEVPETPTKRPRTASPLKSRALASLTKTTTPSLPQREPSPPPAEVSAPTNFVLAPENVVDSAPNMSEAIHEVAATRENQQSQISRRRFKPVYLDTAQWYSLDRRITQALKQVRVR